MAVKLLFDFFNFYIYKIRCFKQIQVGFNIAIFI